MAGGVKMDELVLRLHGVVSIWVNFIQKTTDRNSSVLTHHLERSKVLSMCIDPLEWGLSTRSSQNISSLKKKSRSDGKFKIT